MSRIRLKPHLGRALIHPLPMRDAAAPAKPRNYFSGALIIRPKSDPAPKKSPPHSPHKASFYGTAPCWPFHPFVLEHNGDTRPLTHPYRVSRPPFHGVNHIVELVIIHYLPSPIQRSVENGRPENLAPLAPLRPYEHQGSADSATCGA